MKRLVFSIIILAMIFPVMVITNCSTGNGDPVVNPEDNNPSDDPGDYTPAPSGNLGEGPLELKGVIYTETMDYANSVATYSRYSSSSTIVAWAIGDRMISTVDLVDGEFDISIPEEPVFLFSFDSNSMSGLFNGWDNPTITPDDAQGVHIYLFEQTTNKFIGKKDLLLSKVSPWSITRSVDYVYVDQDVTVTLKDKSALNPDRNDVEYTDIYESAEISLKKGWNALTRKRVEAGTPTVQSSTSSISVENPNFRWVIAN
jgi:hypothetical protein